MIYGPQISSKDKKLEQQKIINLYEVLAKVFSTQNKKLTPEQQKKKENQHEKKVDKQRTIPKPVKNEPTSTPESNSKNNNVNFCPKQQQLQDEQQQKSQEPQPASVELISKKSPTYQQLTKQNSISEVSTNFKTGPTTSEIKQEEKNNQVLPRVSELAIEKLDREPVER